VKWADVLIVNTPHPARRKLKLAYEDVVAGRTAPRVKQLIPTGESRSHAGGSYSKAVR